MQCIGATTTLYDPWDASPPTMYLVHPTVVAVIFFRWARRLTSEAPKLFIKPTMTLLNLRGDGSGMDAEVKSVNATAAEANNDDYMNTGKEDEKESICIPRVWSLPPSSFQPWLRI